MKRLITIIAVCLLIVSGCSSQKEEKTELSEKSLSELNTACVSVEEKDIEMTSDNSGEVELVVKIPDYKKLYKEAYQTEDPEAYVKDALSSGDYETKTVKTKAEVTVEQGEKNIQKQEAMDQLLEKAVIDAINNIEGDE